jgi:PKD repeat protein
MRKSLLLLLLCFTLLSCEKIFTSPKPEAEFDFIQGSGGLVTFINTSKNSSSYFWDFGDGGSSTTFNPTYSYKRNGTFIVTLRANGDGGESTINRTLNISSIPTNGNFIFWSTLSKTIKVYINGSYVGTNTKYMTQGTAPSCGTNGFTTVTLPQGTYNFRAEEDSFFGSTWSGQIDVFNGVCRSLRLIQ